jgi:hypothetical protein
MSSSIFSLGTENRLKEPHSLSRKLFLILELRLANAVSQAGLIERAVRMPYFMEAS